MERRYTSVAYIHIPTHGEPSRYHQEKNFKSLTLYLQNDVVEVQLQLLCPTRKAVPSLYKITENPPVCKEVISNRAQLGGLSHSRVQCRVLKICIHTNQVTKKATIAFFWCLAGLRPALGRLRFCGWVAVRCGVILGDKI